MNRKRNELQYSCINNWSLLIECVLDIQYDIDTCDYIYLIYFL